MRGGPQPVMCLLCPSWRSQMARCPGFPAPSWHWGVVALTCPYWVPGDVVGAPLPSTVLLPCPRAGAVPWGVDKVTEVPELRVFMSAAAPQRKVRALNPCGDVVSGSMAIGRTSRATGPCRVQLLVEPRQCQLHGTRTFPGACSQHPVVRKRVRAPRKVASALRNSTGKCREQGWEVFAAGAWGTERVAVLQLNIQVLVWSLWVFPACPVPIPWVSPLFVRTFCLPPWTPQSALWVAGGSAGRAAAPVLLCSGAGGQLHHCGSLHNLCSPKAKN